MTVLTIKLDYIPPSLNTLLRTHWAKRKKIKDQISKEIYYLAFKYGLESPARRRVEIIINHKRLDDPDNLPARAKLLLDVLKETVLIWDDSSTWIDLEITQKKTKDKEWTDIFIQPVREKKNAKQKK